jgi:hypothetical protein
MACQFEGALHRQMEKKTVWSTLKEFLMMMALRQASHLSVEQINVNPKRDVGKIFHNLST